MLGRKNIMMLRSFARSRSALLALFVPLAAGFTSSCGGAPAAPQAPASSGVPLVSAPLPLPIDLSPVAAPPGLVVTGTITKLGASLATVHGWIQLPMPQSDQVTEVIAGQALGAIVDLDQPIYAAVAVSGSGGRTGASVALSAGVRDVDAAKAALTARYKLTPGDNGALLIKPLGNPSRSGHAGDGSEDDARGSDDDDDGHVCELAPAYGSPAMRLVCGLDGKALATLGPWLTRGATREQQTTDAHVDLRMAPLKPIIAQQGKLLSILAMAAIGSRPGGGLAGSRELFQAVTRDLVDFATDLDTASLDVALSDPGAAVTLSLRLSGATSTVTKLLMANADRNGPPPAAFWQMPGDADFAVFDRGIDPNALARGRDLALKVVSDGLAADGVKDADRHAFVDALGKLCSPAPMVYASGIDPDAVRKALASLKALPDTATEAEQREATRVATRALLGWRIIEADEPVAGRVDAMKALALAWGRPTVAAVYKKAPGGWVAIRSAPMPKGASLPKDTQHFAFDVPLVESVVTARAASKKPSGPPKPLVIDVFLVPDGARSWIGIGGDAGLVTSRLAAAVAGSGDGLRARPELASFKDTVVGAGGFITARGVAETGEQLSALTGGDSGGYVNAAEIFESASQTPHQGTTPIAFSLTAPSTAQAAQGTQASVVATVQVPRATVDDILVVALKHGF